jgi:uncharacterized protein (TIGR02246 family)
MRPIVSVFGVVLACALLLAACQPAQPTVDVAAEKAAIESVLSSYVEAVEREDLDAYAANVAHDDSMVNFGAFGGPIVGWEALKNVMAGQNEGLSDIRIAQHDVRVSVSTAGDLAWATSLWDFTAMMGDQPVDLDVRCTWVLEKNQDGWRIVHFHKSVAAG